MEWKKISSLNATTEDIQEIWIYKNDNEYHEHNVSIKSGKYLDVLDLKDINLKNYKNEINKVKQTRTVIFRHNHKIERCPICNDFSICSTSILNVYGAIYVKCKTCSHCYIINPPKKKELDKFYAGNAQYQNTYADKDKLEDRVNQVVIPKLEYVIDMYKKQFGREPCSILDIAAGSGHFVYACRNYGLQADGIEISKTGIRFCKENFDIDLIDADFIKTYECFSDYDIITFWGVIEHVPLPLKMLAAAQNILKNKEGMVAVEVPRLSCISSSVQSIANKSIIRHLDPLGHINMFTDESLATAFNKSGFDIKAAWYFGMDIYELMCQVMVKKDDDRLFEDIKEFLNPIQFCLDSGRLSDAVVLIGIPKVEE